MTTDKEVYLVKADTKRIKKISIKKLIDNINLECFNKKFFTNKKDAKEHIKNDNR